MDGKPTDPKRAGARRGVRAARLLARRGISTTARRTRKAIEREERLVSFAIRRDAGNLVASGKLLALTLASSAAMGVAAWVFLASLAWVTGMRESYPPLFLLLPAAGALTAWVYRRFGAGTERGNNLVIESAVAGAHIPFRMAPLILGATLATHLAGGSAGREGTAVQMGGTIASAVGERFGLGRRDHQTLVLTGISAAFGAAFGTPLAGTFFGLEMCYIGKLDYRAMLYCLIASFTGNAVTSALGIRHTFETIAAIPQATPRTIAVVVACSVLFGLVGWAFSKCVGVVKTFYARRFKSAVVATLVGSAVACAFFVALGLQRYGGLSEWMVSAGFSGTTTLADPVAKFAATVLTLGSGLQGGEVTPLFGIGSSLGGWLAGFAGLDPSFLAALGLIAVFGSAANAPLTTIMLGIDMFGGGGVMYFVVAAFVSYFTAGHHGLYHAQVIVTPKRRTLADEKDLTINQALSHYEKRAESARDGSGK